MKQLFITNMFGGEPVGLIRIAVSLPLAFLLGYFVSWVYRRSHKGFAYNPSFNMTLILVTLIVSIIMISISANIALSLGLIGSLSIIRFRAVIKDTIDMCFVFWAIATGLTIGATNYLFAIIATGFLGLIAIMLSNSMFQRIRNTDFIVIIHLLPQSREEASPAIESIFNNYQLSWSVRSCETDNTLGHTEIIYEINERDSQQKTAKATADIEHLSGVKKVAMLSSDTNIFV